MLLYPFPRVHFPKIASLLDITFEEFLELIKEPKLDFDTLDNSKNLSIFSLKYYHKYYQAIAITLKDYFTILRLLSTQ